MHNSFELHEHDLKFHTTDMHEDKEKQKENPDTNSKDYDTIRKLVKDRDKPKKKIQ
ncbi:MAG: hypothetical protein ACKPKO_43310 [Candidatus Fonsibacter sp.]